MQEQGISLDEVDQDGNSAVHVAAQHGYLGCIQVNHQNRNGPARLVALQMLLSYKSPKPQSIWSMVRDAGNCQQHLERHK